MASPFVGKDGSRHTNKTSQMAADARYNAKQPAGASARTSARSSAGAMQPGGEAEGDGEAQEPQDGAAMAAEHGPATQLDIQHDHEGGRHTVHAVHPDGHEHESEHPTADEAHQFAAQCAGCGGAGGGTGMMGGE